MTIGTMAGGFVEKGLILRTAPYNTMYRRPYHANFGQNVGMMREITALSDFSKERLAPIAATTLTPSTQVEGEVGIENGWGNERCLFAIKIVHQSNHANTMRTVQYLQGYTDYMGIGGGVNSISMTGKMPIDPRMRLFFNSSLIFMESTTTNGFGQRQTTITPVEACQLLTGTQGTMTGTSTYTLRPEDVYSMIHSQELVSSVGRYNDANGNGPQNNFIQDGRVMFQAGQPIKKSSRDNLIPSNYLSKLLTNSSNVALAHLNEVTPDLANKISASLSEGYMSNDHTLSEMLKRTGLSENGSITYGELCGLFQNTDQVLLRLGMETQKVQGALGQQSEYFNGATWELLISQMLQNVTAALLVNTAMRSIILRGDNMTGGDIAAGIVGGQFRVEALGGNSFVDGRPIEYVCEMVKTRLLQEFLSGYTGHNYVPIAFTMKIDLYGECVIDISYNHGPLIRFVTPMFGDSLFSPVLTDNRAALAHMSAETRSMTHNLFNVL